MSNFGAKLEELLEKRKLTAAELSRTTKISDALISKWINGQQTFVSRENLEALTLAISTHAHDRAQLIRAHLLDEIAGSGGELIDVAIRGEAKLKEIPQPFHTALPLKIRRALEILGRESVVDADVRGILLNLANLCEERPIQTVVDAAGADQVSSLLPDASEARAVEIVKSAVSYSKSKSRRKSVSSPASELPPGAANQAK